mmetsp:Transcript_45487/g.90078  ORF Transcript_45487/g.90078 Transcript_45487/m.90078 type:complete len:196 (+) Transcript_45487:47-634(+)
MNYVLSLLVILLHVTKLKAWSDAAKSAEYMRRCIVLAREAQDAGGGPYGAVIVDPSRGILAEGRNHASHDPIWHGEMSAISNLSAVLKHASVYEVAPDLELYTSAEPCPMCMSAISWSGFGRVVYGTSIPFIEKQGGKQIDIRAAEIVARSHKQIILEGGVLANETDTLYRGNGVHHYRRKAEHTADIPTQLLFS